MWCYFYLEELRLKFQSYGGVQGAILGAILTQTNSSDRIHVKNVWLAGIPADTGMCLTPANNVVLYFIKFGEELHVFSHVFSVFRVQLRN